MYVPKHFAMSRSDAIELARNVGIGHLVTHGPEGLDSSFLPFLVESAGDGIRVIAHFARANGHHRRIAPDMPCLLIVQGPDAYVSPSLYPSKQVHGEVVPTWSYGLVHLRGTARLVDHVEGKEAIVRRLTEHHEASRAEPWSVDDAPRPHVDKLLRAIVGIEIAVDSVVGKAKLIQDDEYGDRTSVRDAFLAGTPGEADVGRLMADALDVDD